MKYLSIALVLVAAIISATILTIHGYGEEVFVSIMIAAPAVIFFGSSL